MRPTRRLRLLLPILFAGGLLWWPSTGTACPPPRLEWRVARADLVARVEIVRIRPVPALLESGRPGHRYAAVVRDRIKGTSGRVDVWSHAELSLGEHFLVAKNCGDHCREGAFLAELALPLDLVASARRPGDWFSLAFSWAGMDREGAAIEQEGSGDEQRRVADWRTIERIAARADDFLACEARRARIWLERVGAVCGPADTEDDDEARERRWECEVRVSKSLEGGGENCRAL